MNHKIYNKNLILDFLSPLKICLRELIGKRKKKIYILFSFFPVLFSPSMKKWESKSHCWKIWSLLRPLSCTPDKEFAHYGCNLHWKVRTRDTCFCLNLHFSFSSVLRKRTKDKVLGAAGWVCTFTILHYQNDDF